VYIHSAVVQAAPVCRTALFAAGLLYFSK